jgi:uncharacterized NAD(P)/FAD-binding protein YdhS
MATKKTIAIIGAGACGVLVLNQLVAGLSRTRGQGAKIFLIEKGKEFGLGLAYSTLLASHILNMRADTMSAFPDDPDHFGRWLADSRKSGNTDEYDRKSFPPRKIYGDYLKDILSGALHKAEVAGIQIECINDEAINLSRTTEGYGITFKNIPPIRSDDTVLALGNFPSGNYDELDNIKGYFNSPWPVESILQNIPGNVSVAIIGSSLSAIDALHTLLEAGQKEKIYFVSRNGWLPKVRSLTEAYDLKFLTLENINRLLTAKKLSALKLDEIVDLFFKEIEAAEGKSIDRAALLKPAGSALEILEADLARAKQKSIPYQNALIATDPIIENIWDLMSIEDRIRFDQEYRSLWTVYRYPMPPINAEKICRILKSGQLEVLPGSKRICHLPSANRFAIEMVDRNGSSKTLEVAAVINATGQGSNVRKFNSNLIRNLLSDHTIAPHPNGGIIVDFNTNRVIDSEGKISDSLFAIGGLTKGAHFYTSGIAPCARKAQVIADFILGRQIGSS